MNQGYQLRQSLENFLSKAKNGKISCIIPDRMGLRKMVDGHTFHEHPELFIQLEGSTHFHFPNQELILEPGVMLIVPTELPHEEQIVGSGELYERIVFEPMYRYLRIHSSGISEQKTPIMSYFEIMMGMDNMEILQVIEQIIEVGNPIDELSRTISQGLIISVLARALKSLKDKKINNSERHESQKIRFIRNAVLCYYHQSDLSVKKLASQLSCSADYLSWLYHKETGKNLKGFIGQVRLKKASDLLRNTDYTISEIAWICGFNSPSYFSKVFSKQFDLSPRDFRRKS